MPSKPAAGCAPGGTEAGADESLDMSAHSGTGHCERTLPDARRDAGGPRDRGGVLMPDAEGRAPRDCSHEISRVGPAEGDMAEGASPWGGRGGPMSTW